MTKFWGKFCINFALDDPGLTMAISIWHQLGILLTMWVIFLEHPWQLKGCMAFFLESTFIGYFSLLGPLEQFSI